jgi:ribonuclease HII
MIPNQLPDFPTLDIETALWANGVLWVAGIDEAGRGALAGPVTTAAVIFPQLMDLQSRLSGVRDSKKMSPSQRVFWKKAIQETAVTYGVGMSSAQEIDMLGIIKATKLSAKRAISALSVVPDHLLIDHFQISDICILQTSLPKGDVLSLSIAAASILAKTTRDAVICEMGRKYPDYGFEKHKGYGTKAHLDAIYTCGITPLHRKSFEPIKSVGEVKYSQGSFILNPPDHQSGENNVKG